MLLIGHITLYSSVNWSFLCTRRKTQWLMLIYTTSSPYYYLPSCSFAPQYFYLHIIICTSITPVLMLNCKYFASKGQFIAYPPTLLHLHTYISLLCYWLYVCLCVTLCCCFCHTALLYLGQVAVLNENWPTWLNKMVSHLFSIPSKHSWLIKLISKLKIMIRWLLVC
jgi:hypothetical protein